jgi:hypothetical protein
MRMARKLAVLGVATIAAAAPAAPAAGSSGEGGVLVVGDSLEVLTSPYLERYLPDLPLTVNAEGGYNSYQIFDLFRESYDPAQSVIVFDAGTNDNPAYPQILAGNLEAVAGTIGDRCMVVPTIHGFTVDGVGNEGKNRVVAEFAASRPGTQTPDWARGATTRPDLMLADDLHPTPEGADYRAQLIARGVRGCLAFISGAGGEPVLESKPEMALVSRLAGRQARLSRAIALEMARRLGNGIARHEPSLAGALTFASLRYGCNDLMPICAPLPRLGEDRQ